DIAYHKTKIDRNFLNLVDVWGADHGGYVKRMQAAGSSDAPAGSTRAAAEFRRMAPMDSGGRGVGRRKPLGRRCGTAAVTACSFMIQGRRTSGRGGRRSQKN
ncbi:MAG: hypothetical protein WA399_04775, partial [Acidobacteriaceae bacterium]